MNVSARELGDQKLGALLRETTEDLTITECFGERFIACGASNRTVTIHGTPGNALAAYLDGATVVVNGNAQDAVGDTMNAGRIVIHGNAGDALGYAMRGGEIYVEGSTGYRTGIHMKQYEADKRPVLVVGGSAGSFLGEYLAGGLILVLGRDTEEVPVGNFTGTGMHGGEIWIRSSKEPDNLPAQVSVEQADPTEILPYLNRYCELFGVSCSELLTKPFYRLRPNAKNPYKRLYTEN